MEGLAVWEISRWDATNVPKDDALVDLDKLVDELVKQESEE